MALSETFDDYSVSEKDEKWLPVSPFLSSEHIKPNIWASYPWHPFYQFYKKNENKVNNIEWDNKSEKIDIYNALVFDWQEADLDNLPAREEVGDILEKYYSYKILKLCEEYSDKVSKQISFLDELESKIEFIINNK